MIARAEHQRLAQGRAGLKPATTAELRKGLGRLGGKRLWCRADADYEGAVWEAGREVKAFSRRTGCSRLGAISARGVSLPAGEGGRV